MALAVGVFLALGVGLIGTVVGLDRDRAFYPTAMIVIASLYALFAVMASSTQALLLESLVGVVFIALAIVGFKSSLWIVAAALAAHGCDCYPRNAATSSGPLDHLCHWRHQACEV